MHNLDHAHEHLNDIVKRKLKINPGLTAVEQHPETSSISKTLRKAMIAQVNDLLKSGMFDDVDRAIGKLAKETERIITDSDELEIEDAVKKNIKPMSEKVGEAFADFLILIFNMGGQDFLNKHNIPAEFKLTNAGIQDGVRQGGKLTLQGVDNTTAEWVADQISSGRKAGKSNADIADAIRDKVPQTYEGRAERIVRTESANMVGDSEQITAQRNGASHKEWVTVSDGNVCPVCEENEGAGVIGIDQAFPSGALREPAHPNCRCLVEYHFTPFMGTIWHGQ